MNVKKKDLFGNLGAKGKIRRPVNFNANAASFTKPVNPMGFLRSGDPLSKMDLSSQASSVSAMSSSQCSSIAPTEYSEGPLSMSADYELSLHQSSSERRSSLMDHQRRSSNVNAKSPNQFDELMRPFLRFRDGVFPKQQIQSTSAGEARGGLKVSFEDDHSSPAFKKPKLLFGDSDRKSSSFGSKTESDIFRVLANASNVSDNFSVADLRAPLEEAEGPLSSQAERINDVFPGSPTFRKNDSRKSTTSVQPNSTTSTSGRDIAEKTPKRTPKANSSSLAVTSDSDASACIIAVTEGRGHARGEVGIAAMDPRRPHLILCQISDTQRYTHSLAKMNVFNFVEAIVPNTFVEGGAPRKLFLDMLERFPNVSINHVQRRHFSEQFGLQLIHQYCSKDSESVMIVLRDKFYALSAAAALLKYIEYTQNVLVAPRSLKVEYQGIEGTMIIDLDTASRLELVMGLSSGDPAHSLFGALKHCRTKGGLRLLRANILQPPADAKKIDSRLTCVKELIDNPILFNAVEAAVSQLSSAESLLSLCMHPPQQTGLKAADFQMKYTLMLKSTLEIIPSLSIALGEATSEYFSDVRENLQDVRFQKVIKRILLTITDGPSPIGRSANNQHNSYFMIRTDINGLLDIARKTYSELAQDISLLVTELAAKHGLPLRLHISQNRGFHIQLPVDALKDKELPSEFILVEKGRSMVSCHTSELVALDQRCQQSLNEIKLMANVLLFELLNDIREDIVCLFPLCEYIAEIDVCIAFAHIGASQDYICPKFGHVLKLKEARHPILDAIAHGRTVANDIFADTENNFIILTGPNQSGKSIYIRQIALLQIMAQIGCYIPAKEAAFRIADRIFSRIGFDDSIECNASSLMVELRDMDFIQRNLTPTSLVIVDELCRGTSVDEGSSLAFAIAEELLDSKAFVFFTTHFMILTKMEQMYCNVRNFHFEALLAVEERPTLRFTHRMLTGVTPADQYGIRLAELMGFPPSVLANAKHFAEILKAQQKPQPIVCDLTSRYEIARKLRQRLAAFGPTCWEDMAPFVQQAHREYSLLPPADENFLNLLDSIALPPNPVSGTVTTDSQSNVTAESACNEKNPEPAVQQPVCNVASPVAGALESASNVAGPALEMAEKVPSYGQSNAVIEAVASDLNSPSVQMAAEMLLCLQRSIPSGESSSNGPRSCGEGAVSDITVSKRQMKPPKSSKKEQEMEQLRSILSDFCSKSPAVSDKSAYYEWKYSKKKSIQTVAVASRQKRFVSQLFGKRATGDLPPIANVPAIDEAMNSEANEGRSDSVVDGNSAAVSNVGDEPGLAGISSDDIISKTTSDLEAVDVAQKRIVRPDSASEAEMGDDGVSFCSNDGSCLADRPTDS